MVVVEVTHLPLGTIMNKPDLYLEIFMEIPPDVAHIACHHVPITSIHLNIQIAHQLNTTPHLVKKPVNLHPD